MLSCNTVFCKIIKFWNQMQKGGLLFKKWYTMQWCSTCQLNREWKGQPSWTILLKSWPEITCETISWFSKLPLHTNCIVQKPCSCPLQKPNTTLYFGRWRSYGRNARRWKGHPVDFRYHNFTTKWRYVYISLEKENATSIYQCNSNEHSPSCTIKHSRIVT